LLSASSKISQNQLDFFYQESSFPKKKKIKKLRHGNINSGSKNPMYGKPKSSKFLEWMGKPRFGKDNYMYENGIHLEIWTTQGDYVGSFKTLKTVVKQ
jgi:hypothetical protein